MWKVDQWCRNVCGIGSNFPEVKKMLWRSLSLSFTSRKMQNLGTKIWTTHQRYEYMVIIRGLQLLCCLFLLLFHYTHLYYPSTMSALISEHLWASLSTALTSPLLSSILLFTFPTPLPNRLYSAYSWPLCLCLSLIYVYLYLHFYFYFSCYCVSPFISKVSVFFSL